MDEIISKASLLGKLEELPADRFFNVGSIRNFIKAEPEAVEIVKCKDCKYADRPSFTGTYCMRNKSYSWDDNSFCSYGER